MKHKRKDRPVEKRVNIPTSVVSRIDEQLRDPLTMRPRHGAWAKLITALLAGWLRGDFLVTIKLKHKPRPFCPSCLEDLEEGICFNPSCEAYRSETHAPTTVQNRPAEGSAGS